jgi:hypothetical protein
MEPMIHRSPGSGANRPKARELERAAAAARPRVTPRPAAPAVTPPGEALAMLARRGFHPSPAPPDLPFSADLAGEAAEALARALGRYAFRLFLRGAIQRGAGFRPEQATRYLTPSQARSMAKQLVELGLAEPVGRSRFRLTAPARSFGGTLEWFVARELRVRLGFDVASGLRFHARGVGGDLDVVAAAEGRLVYLELKSSPPRHLSEGEVAAFFERVRALRPDLALFVMDTALRLEDKVVPMLQAELARGGAGAAVPRRVVRELWALTPSLYAVNGRHDLIANVARAIAEGLRALAPAAP